MTRKPVVRRRRANADIDDAVEHYFLEGGIELATAFANQLQLTTRSISRRPAIGSPRYSNELQIPGLRHRAMKRFPYLVLYREKEFEIEIVRVLHERMVIPSRLEDI